MRFPIPKSRRRSARPRLEGLESRRLLSVTINEFPVTKPSNILLGYDTVGPDGNIWFTEANATPNPLIGIVNPNDGVISEVPTGSPSITPSQLTAGPDGNLWFTEERADQIGQLNPVDGFIDEYPIPPTDPNPDGITVGPDGDLWFTEQANNEIGQLIPGTGVVTLFPIPTVGSEPTGITAGPDGDLWFTEFSANQIGQVVLGISTPTPTPAPDLRLGGTAPAIVISGQDVTYSLTVTNDGTGEATGVSLSDALPTGVTFVSATGGVAPVDGDLAADAGAGVSIVVTTRGVGTLNDAASVTMDQTEPNPADASVTLNTSVAAGVVTQTPTPTPTPTPTATPTPTPTPTTTPTPTVVSVHRSGFHALPTKFVLDFDEPLDAAQASDPASYHLVDVTDPGQPIRFRSATYNAASQSVTLRPAHRLYLYNHYRLTVGDLRSLAVDAGASATGGEFVAILTPANLVLTAAQRRDASLMALIRSLAVTFPGLEHLVDGPASRPGV